MPIVDRRSGFAALGPPLWGGISFCLISRFARFSLPQPCILGLGPFVWFHSMLLLPDRLTLMQRLQDAARLGYTRYVIDQVELQKWPSLARKFELEYDCALTKSTRSRRRKSGEAVCMLFACQPPPYAVERKIVWVLVVTDGVGRVAVREQLKFIRSERIELEGYELVHDGVSWSWQMTRKRFNYWKERIHAVAAKQPKARGVGEDYDGPFDPDIEKIMDALYHAPGFRLVRRQVGKLVAYAKGEWRRLRADTGVPIRTRDFLPYVQRLPNVKKAKAQKRTESK